MDDIRYRSSNHDLVHRHGSGGGMETMKRPIDDMTRNQLIGNLRSYKGNCEQQATKIKQLREPLKEAADEVYAAGGSRSIQLDSMWLEKAQDALK